MQIDILTQHSKLNPVAASFTFTVPIAIFVLGIWWIALRDSADRLVNIMVPSGALLIFLDPLVPLPFTLTAAILILIVVVLVLREPVPKKNHGATRRPDAPKEHH